MSVSSLQKVRLEKAAVDEGFGLRRDDQGVWLVFGSVAAPASILLTFEDDRYVMAVDHPGVATELSNSWDLWDGEAPAGLSAFAVTDTAHLHNLIRETWRLAKALPAAPLREFEARTRSLPRSTEAERLVVQRVGQDVFRNALLRYWDGACAVLGVTEPSLLRASHIIPWAECASDAERLDVFNGLLLSAHLDAAFDAHLISFDDTGLIVFANSFSLYDRQRLQMHEQLALRSVSSKHLVRLAEHRSKLRS